MHTAIVATLKQKTNVPTSPSWLLLTFDFEGFLALKSKFTSGKLSKYFPIFSFEINALTSARTFFLQQFFDGRERYNCE
jgi:hypothetical protein